MPVVYPIEAAGYIVHAGFMGDMPVFATGDGAVYRDEERVAVHAGGLLAALPTARGLLTGGDDGRVVLTPAAGDAAVVAERPGKWIDRVATGPTGAVAFAAGRTVWVVEPKGVTHELQQPRAVGGLFYLPKGNRLAIATYGGVRLVYPGTAGDPTLLDWKGSHVGVTASPDGKFIISIMQENAMHGWRLSDGQHMAMSGYPAKIRNVSWSVKGRYLASTGAPAAILWPFLTKDGPLGKQPLQLGARRELATQVACHPAEEVVAVGYSDGMILLVRFSDAEEVLLRAPGSAPISALGWDAEGRNLAFGSEAGEAGFVDVTA